VEPTTVESLCNLLGRSRLLATDQIRNAFQRWRGEAGEAAGDLPRFARWLVAKEYLTSYQADLLLRGRADRFFLSDYKLLDRIGAGRMAGVYKAAHKLGQVVAIKVLPPSKAKEPTSFARFQREARLALKLRHPNIVRAFQVGVDGGLNYLVMEFLDGETLEEVLQRRGKLPPAEAVRLVHQACLGLEHLHEQDMVHRDLKPANMMLVPGHVPGRPDTTLQSTLKILDVGLGRALFDEGESSGVPQDLTAPGTILGTPDYMAPEQGRDAHAADIRADIYSLGCTLYHLLAGQPPFPGGNAVAKIIRHSTEKPPPLKNFNPAVPDGLQQIMDWMMAKDPAQRYPTPERAGQALQVFLTAGAPADRIETEPKMQAYLRWLETEGAAQTDVVPAALPVAAPVAMPVAANPPAAIPLTQAETLLVPPRPAPAFRPASAFEVQAAENSEGTKTSLFSRRDLMMLGIGIGAAAALVLGFWWLGRNR